jgi:hypothetical protein
VSAAVDVQRLTSDEARCLEVEHGLDDFLDRAHAAHGVERREEAVRFGRVHGGLDDAGDTAFTRMPLPAYSIASDRVTASRPPLVRAASAEGTAVIGWSTRLVVILTI